MSFIKKITLRNNSKITIHLAATISFLKTVEYH